MEKKTLVYINSKVWYRLIKVLFVLLFLASLIIFNTTVPASIGPNSIDQGRSIIQCNFKNKRVIKPGDIYLTLYKNDFDNGIFNYKKYFLNTDSYKVLSILEACAPDTSLENATIFDWQKITEIGKEHGYIGRELTKEENDIVRSEYNQFQENIKGLISNTSKARFLKFDTEIFTIIPVFSSRDFINSIVFGNLGIIVLFEFIRRIFYYVLLGKLFPKN